MSPVLGEYPHLELERLPSYGPRLNVIKAHLETVAAGDAQPLV
jgi:hypothetical protein